MTTMRKFLALFLMVFCFGFYANASELDVALQKTYVACVGIDDELTDMKKMAGINTAITGVGTVAGGGALVAGIKKQNMLEKLRMLENSKEEARTEVVFSNTQDFTPALRAKKLGNWRTGLLAVNTATNVAGAIIASKNRVDVDLQEKISECINSVDVLQHAIMQAKLSGIDVSEANGIYDACVDYKYIDLSPIEKRGKGAEISSIIGGGAGIVGTITSAAANKENDSEKSKKLDTTSNVLAGGATVLSGAAVVFNATQISAIKKVVEVAQKCEGALK